MPTERGGTTLYVSDQRSSQTNWAASRSIGDLAAWVSIPAAVADEPTISVAAGIATGLHLVTESEWATTFRSAVATMASAPRQATMTIDGLRVTHHVAGWIDAVCATKGKDTSCHQNNQTGFGRAMDATNTPVYDPLEAGGTWAYAGYAPDVQGAPSYPLVGETLDGRRVGSSTPRSTDDLGGGKLFAFVAPDEADTLREADTNGPQATFGSNPVVRPIR